MLECVKLVESLEFIFRWSLEVDRFFKVNNVSRFFFYIKRFKWKKIILE